MSSTHREASSKGFLDFDPSLGAKHHQITSPQKNVISSQSSTIPQAKKIEDSSRLEVLHSTIAITHPQTVDSNKSQFANNQFWPNPAEGQKLRVLKRNVASQSFSQKVQAGKRGSNSLNQGPGVHEPGQHDQQSTSTRLDGLQMENFKREQEPNVTQYKMCNDAVSENNLRSQLVLSHSNIKTKDEKSIKTNDPQKKKLPLQDSRVHLINSTLKEKWMEIQGTKKLPTVGQLPVLEKDFPDLTSAWKHLTKYVIKDETFDEGIDGREISCTESDKRRQPRRKDPISVNLVDIMKTKSQISPKNIIRRIYMREFKKCKLGGNYLDSSNPLRKRGKYREVPPKKVISTLKTIILKERERKREQGEKMLRLLTESSLICDQSPSTELPSETICNKLEALQISESSNEAESFSVDINTSCGSERVICEKSVGHESINLSQQHYVVSLPHSRKFREYCDNMLGKSLDEAVTNLLREVYRFQDRFHQRDPIKAHARRRFVLGIREVKKFLALKKLKAIVIAPDLEPCQAEGGLDDTVIQIREEGKLQQIPVIFAIGRRKLGFTFKKKVPISIVGIINPEGAEELYHLMLQEWSVAAQEYAKRRFE